MPSVLLLNNRGAGRGRITSKAFAMPSLRKESSQRQFSACTSRRPGLSHLGVMVGVLANAQLGSGHAKGLARKAEHLHRVPLSPASQCIFRDPAKQRARLVRSQQAYSLQTTLPRLRKKEWAARLVCRAGSAAIDAGAWDAAGGDRDSVAAAAVEEVHSLVWDFSLPVKVFSLTLMCSKGRTCLATRALHNTYWAACLCRQLHDVVSRSAERGQCNILPVSCQRDKHPQRRGAAVAAVCAAQVRLGGPGRAVANGLCYKLHRQTPPFAMCLLLPV